MSLDHRPHSRTGGAFTARLLGHGCRLLFVLLVFVAAARAAESASASKPKPKTASQVEDEYELQRMLVDTLDQVERNYVKGISRRELVEAAINGILEKLDPYSDYIAADELDQFRTSMESRFGGIGIQVTMDRGQLEVLSPLPNTPAYRAGLLAGDAIVEIDGKSTEDITLAEAVRRLKGRIGEKVVLTVIHPGKNEEEKVTVTRQRIRVQTVLGDRRKENNTWDYMYDHEKGIGYIRLTAFGRGAADELRRAIKSLKKEKLTGLILDLRNNPGGLLSSAIEVSDMFIEKGRIVSTSGRNVPERVWEAREANTFADFPMVVLVNRFSASASEIVSACLQDHKRAVIIGERTWGKGSVQNVIPLEHGKSALKLTTASYQRPSGKNIHRFPGADEDEDWGVTPNDGYEIKLSKRDMIALLRDRRSRDIIRPKPADPTPKPSSSEKDEKTGDMKDTDDPTQPFVVDRALRKAVEYLSSELVKAE